MHTGITTVTAYRPHTGIDVNGTINRNSRATPGVRRDHSLGRRDPRSLDEAVSRICRRDTKPPHGPCPLFAHRNFPPPSTWDLGRRLPLFSLLCRHTLYSTPSSLLSPSSSAFTPLHRTSTSAWIYGTIASSTLDSPHLLVSRRRLDRHCVLLRCWIFAESCDVGFL